MRISARARRHRPDDDRRARQLPHGREQANEDGDDRGDACPHMAGTVPGTDADDDDGIGKPMRAKR